MDRYQSQIRQLLDGIAARRKQEGVLHGILLSLIFLSIMLLSTLLAHTLFGIDAVSRFALFLLTLSAVLTTMIHYLIVPLLRKPDARSLANRLDNTITELEGSLLPALDIEALEGNPRRPFSEQLIHLARERVWKILEGRSRGELHLAAGAGRGRRALVLLLILMVSAGAWYASLLIFGDTAGRALAGITDPLDSIKEETIWRHIVSPGDTSILRGEIPVIRLSLAGDIFTPVIRKHVPVLQYREGRGKPVSIPLVPDGNGEYIALLGPLVSKCTYRIQLGRSVSPEYRYGVIDLPSVTWLKYSLAYPGYTGLDGEDVQDRGDGLSVIRGTGVELAGSSNNQLDSAWIEYEDGESSPVETDGRYFKTSFEANNSQRFRIRLVDTLGNAGGDSLSREVRVIHDQIPSVNVLLPGQDVTVPPGLELPLLMRAEDDFGIGGTGLVYWGGEREEDTEKRIPIRRSGAGKRIIQDRYLWQLADVEASPGDVISYYVEAVDNDAVSGPKSGRSRTYEVRFPTMTEYLRERLEGGEEIRTGLEDILTEAKRLRELSDELEKKLRGAQELDWEKKREIEALATQGEDLLEDIKDMCSRVENSLGDSEKIFSDEVLEKMMEVRDLLEKFATPEMMESIERLQQAMESLPPSFLEQAMKNFRLKQDQLVNNLDRTLTALRRLELEQRLEAIEKGLGELAKRQNALNEEMEGTNSEETSQLARDEERLARELAALAEEMKEAAAQMSDYGETEAGQEMSDIIESAEGEVKEGLEELVDTMEKGLADAAREGGKKSEKDLAELQNRVGGLLSRLRDRWREGTEQEIARALSDLVTLSRKQGEIVERTKDHGSRFGPGVWEEILAQQELVAGLAVVSHYLDKAAENSFFISPAVIINLSMSISKGHQAAVELNRGDRNPAEVAKTAGESQTYINKTASGLLTDLQALQCSASGTGLEEAFRQMEQLANMQAGLNQGTQEMLMPVPGSGSIRLTDKEKALLAEMAAEERAIAEGLEGLSDSVGGMRNILGELRELAREAEDLSREMDSQRISPEILERQRKILTRLLDAQRSMQEREHSKKRRAESGSLKKGNPPERLTSSILQGPGGETLLEIMEGWRGSYPSRYENLVFEYLKEVLPGDSGGEKIR